MQIGKLDVTLEEHERLETEVFRFKVKNPEKTAIFEVKDDELTLLVSKETASLLAHFINSKLNQ